MISCSIVSILVGFTTDVGGKPLQSIVDPTSLLHQYSVSIYDNYRIFLGPFGIESLPPFAFYFLQFLRAFALHNPSPGQPGQLPLNQPSYWVARNLIILFKYAAKISSPLFFDLNCRGVLQILPSLEAPSPPTSLF